MLAPGSARQTPETGILHKVVRVRGGSQRETAEEIHKNPNTLNLRSLASWYPVESRLLGSSQGGHGGHGVGEG